MSDYQLCASVLAADTARLGDECKNMLSAGADRIHFDVMDNHFVPNLTFGPQICEALRKFGITQPIDVHLMVEPVTRLAQDFINAGATSISFHPHACDDSLALVSDIKAQGIRQGIAVNPDVSLLSIDDLLAEVDFVLIMSVFPGFGGQAFIPDTLPKLEQLVTLRQQRGLNFDIEVDGGVKASNVAEIAKAGANMFVAGSALYNGQDYDQSVQAFREALKRI